MTRPASVRATESLSPGPGVAASWSQTARTALDKPGNRPLLTAPRERLESMRRMVHSPVPPRRRAVITGR
jgi:hypothetical protein